MAKRYIKIGWENKPSVKTPVNMANLGRMDKGIDDCDNAIEEIYNKRVNNVVTTNEDTFLAGPVGKVLQDQVTELNKNIDNSNKFSANGIAVDSGYTAAAECLLQVAISTTTAQYSGAEFAINDITRGAFGAVSANMGVSQIFTVRLQHGDKLTYVINAAGGSVTAKVFPKS